MNVSDQKKKLRKKMLLKRAVMSKSNKAEYDQWIRNSLWKKIEENDYKTVHCYLPMGTEINITPLIESLLEKGLTVVAPKTLAKRKLKNLLLSSLDDLEEGVFGTVHPTGEHEYEGDYDLIIVPGLAFDLENYRLGYGGGYYDNFMIEYPRANKIGIFYPFQEVGKVPLESHDIRLDEIIVDRHFSGLHAPSQG